MKNLAVLFLTITIIIACSISSCDEDIKNKTIDTTKIDTNKIDTSKYLYNIYIKKDSIISNVYQGCGVQWSAYPHNKQWGYPMTQAKWNKLYTRLDSMKPQIIRLMISAGWQYYKGWDYSLNVPLLDYNIGFTDLAKILDYCQSRNIDVIFGEWGVPSPMSSFDNISWRNMAIDYLDFLVTDKKYTCIKYYNFGNEPNGTWATGKGDWTKWSFGAKEFQKRLDVYGIGNSVKMASPDACDIICNSAYSSYLFPKTSKSWLQGTDSLLETKLGCYDFHYYVGQSYVKNNLLYEGLKTFLNGTNPSIPFIMGELGFKYSSTTDKAMYDENKARALADQYADDEDCNMFVYDYIYGIDMADAVIQATNAGCDGFIAWDLDDAMHTAGDAGSTSRLKKWGMWNILGTEICSSSQEENIRPWYFTWTMLSRYFPKGTTIVGCRNKIGTNIRIMAGLKDGKISIAILNRATESKNLKMIFDIDGKFNLKQFIYAEDERKTNSDGFPLVTKTFEKTEISKGFDITIKGNSFMLLTSY